MATTSRKTNRVLKRAVASKSASGKKISSKEGTRILRVILSNGKLSRAEYNSISKLRKGAPPDIDKADMKKAFGKLSGKKSIKKKNHDDLVLLMARCDIEAANLLCKKIFKMKNNGLERLASDSIEKRVVNTIVKGAKHINFTSPTDSSIRYTPNAYYDISRMISRWGSVEVWEMFRSAYGSYTSRKDRLFYRKSNRPPRQRQSTVIHEATHVIQDWQGYRTKWGVRTRIDYETDAHIAQTIFLLKTNGDLYGRLPGCRDAAELIIYGDKLTARSREYQDARESVGTAYKATKKDQGTAFDKDDGSLLEELWMWLPSLGKPN